MESGAVKEPVGRTHRTSSAEQLRDGRRPSRMEHGGAGEWLEEVTLGPPATVFKRLFPLA